jgi:uncharacterized protein YfbU (UPF0304 family)
MNNNLSHLLPQVSFTILAFDISLGEVMTMHSIRDCSFSPISDVVSLHDTFADFLGFCSKTDQVIIKPIRELSGKYIKMCVRT